MKPRVSTESRENLQDFSRGLRPEKGLFMLKKNNHVVMLFWAFWGGEP